MNKKPCLIVGCGSHSHSVISVVESQEQFVISGLVDTNNSYNKNEEKLGYPVITCLDYLAKNSSEFRDYVLILAVGDNQQRRCVFEELDGLGFVFPNIIAKTAFVDANARLGSGNFIGHMSVINANAQIGSNNIINTGTIIEHDVSVFDHCHLAPSTTLCGGVTVSDMTFLGAGATILPRLFIGEATVVGAGACLTSDIKLGYQTLVGVPARRIK